LELFSFLIDTAILWGLSLFAISVSYVFQAFSFSPLPLPLRVAIEIVVREGNVVIFWSYSTPSSLLTSEFGARYVRNPQGVIYQSRAEVKIHLAKLSHGLCFFIHNPTTSQRLTAPCSLLFRLSYPLQAAFFSPSIHLPLISCQV
jgi:hypothetical protein